LFVLPKNIFLPPPHLTKEKHKKKPKYKDAGGNCVGGVIIREPFVAPKRTGGGLGSGRSPTKVTIGVWGSLGPNFCISAKKKKSFPPPQRKKTKPNGLWVGAPRTK